MITVAIDPGLRGCGVAVYDIGQLCAVFYVESPEKTLRGPRAWRAMVKAVADTLILNFDELVVELPQFDGRTADAAPDVFEVVGVAGALLAHFAPHCALAVCPTPTEWTCNVPKDVRFERLHDRLSLDELLLLDGADHNTWDAAALGYWHCQRARTCVI